MVHIVRVSRNLCISPALLFFAEMTTGSLFQLFLFVVTSKIFRKSQLEEKKSYFYQNDLKLLVNSS